MTGTTATDLDAPEGTLAIEEGTTKLTERGTEISGRDVGRGPHGFSAGSSVLDVDSKLAVTDLLDLADGDVTGAGTVALEPEGTGG